MSYQQLLDNYRALYAATTPGTWIRDKTGILSFGSPPAAPSDPLPYRMVYFASCPPAIPHDGDIAFLIWAHNLMDFVLMEAAGLLDQRDALRAVLAEALKIIESDVGHTDWLTDVQPGTIPDVYLRGRDLLDTTHDP